MQSETKHQCFYKILVTSCASLYKMKKTGRNKPIKLGFFQHKIESVLSDIAEPQTTSWPQTTQDFAKWWAL